jgi:hypothetical protein
MDDSIERACFEQLTLQLKEAGEWVWTRGWQKDPPSFKSIRAACQRLLKAYPEATTILTMRHAMLRILREVVLERGLNLIVPVKDSSKVFQIPRSALFDASGVRIRDTLAIHPPPPGSEIYTGPVDLIVTGCLGFNPQERRLYSLDNDKGAYLLEEWRGGLLNGFRIPRCDVVAIAADQQQVSGWPACMRSFLQADYVYTPTRVVQLGVDTLQP